VSPEAALYLAKAREALGEAKQIVAINLAQVAARSAYYVAFHAAEAMVFQQTGRAAKTHAGVRAEFSRLARSEPRITPDIKGFLARACQYEEVSDYSVDPGEAVTIRQAEQAKQLAEQFVDTVQTILR
jgi:uncharacterized protein (UPF0332 family)